MCPKKIDPINLISDLDCLDRITPKKVRQMKLEYTDVCQRGFERFTQCSFKKGVYFS